MKGTGGLLVALALAVGVIACRTEKPGGTGSTGAAIDRSRLCRDGGAELDAKSNECVCPDAARWNGLKCEAAGGDQPGAASMVGSGGGVPGPEVERDEVKPAAAVSAATGTEGGSAAETASQSPGSSTVTTAGDGAGAAAGGEPAQAGAAGGGEAVAGSVDLSRLPALCRAGGGTFVAADAYCLCPGGQALVAGRCRPLSGQLTDDACVRALSRGRWDKGLCLCGSGLVFSPARGGCVAPAPSTSTAVLRRTCESAHNGGRWDARLGRCECAEGRVWKGELCVSRERLASRDICESEYNRGKWNGARRRCACPEGQLWLDQRCQPAGKVDEAKACVTDGNGGRWQAQLKTCVCPRDEAWNAAARLCGK